MPEMFPGPGNLAEKLDDELENEIEDFAESFGLFVKIPKPGTEAYNRLRQACELYAQAVDLQCKSLIEKTRENSEKNRRSLHNKLCVMLLGKTWHETSKEDRDRISNLAVTVGGKEEYVDTF